MVLFDVCSFLFDGMAAPASESGAVALLRGKHSQGFEDECSGAKKTQLDEIKLFLRSC